MMKPGTTLLFLAAAALAATVSMTAPAQAQASRTWVSGVGDDVNPCSRTAPCKTLAGAISKTAAGGEIDCLDPAGYGAVTITKAITIDCASGETGAVGSVLVSGTNGIVVAAGANDVVEIRKIEIQGISGNGNGGLSGIRFLSGKSLHLDNVNIMNFTTHGIDFEPSAAASLDAINVNIMNCAGNGVNVAVGGSGLIKVALRDVRVSQGGTGVRVADNPSATIHTSIDNSSASNNSSAGIIATTGGGQLTMLINRSTVVNNGGTGLNSDGANTEVRVGNSVRLRLQLQLRPDQPAVGLIARSGPSRGGDGHGSPSRGESRCRAPFDRRHGRGRPTRPA